MILALGGAPPRREALDFTSPIASGIQRAMKLKDIGPRLLKIGSIPGSGDLEFAFVPAALEKLAPKDVIACCIWLHGIPYHPGRAHLHVHIQERLTASTLPYATSPGRAEDLIAAVRAYLRHGANTRAVILVAAHDDHKADLKYLFRPLLDHIRMGRVLLIGSAGTSDAVARWLPGS